MSSTILHAKPEDISSSEKRGKYSAAIVGCGQAGILLAHQFAEAGFRVICTDPDPTIINLLTKGKAPFLNRETETKLKEHARAGRLNATTEAKVAIAQSDIVTITTPVKIDRKKSTDYSDIENTCKRVGANLRGGTIVIVTSVVGVGTTEGIIKEILENTSGLKTGTDFGLAYWPVGHEQIITATDKKTLDLVLTIAQAVLKIRVQRIESVRTAEATALFEAVRKETAIALSNELAIFCEKAGIDYHKTTDMQETNADPPITRLTLAEEDAAQSLYILFEDAENLNTKLRIPTIATEVNEETVKHAANLTKDALRNAGKTLKRAKISVLGISQTPNEKGPPKKTAKQLAEALEARGAKVSLYDPHFSEEELNELGLTAKKSLNDALEGADCLIILTAHDQIKRVNLGKLRLAMKSPAAIVDLDVAFDPDKIEKEGLIYRGLGRGVWKK